MEESFLMSAAGANVLARNFNRSDGLCPSALSGAFPRYCCAAVLLVAMALKTNQLVTDPALGVSSGSRWLQAGLIESECIIAAWLLSGSRQRWCRRVSLVTFAGFGCYSLYLALNGMVSCGCFGRLSVNPWWTSTLDAVLVLLLRRWKPSSAVADRGFESNREHRGRATMLVRNIAAPGIIGLFLAVIAGRGGPRTMIDAESIADQSSVILMPESWIGRRFPLTADIDIGEHLSRGSWTLVFYHHDCPKCREALPRYERLAEKWRHAGLDSEFALIQVPPYVAEVPVTDRSWWHGTLSDRKEWFVTTPAEVKLVDGWVVAASSGNVPQ